MSLTAILLLSISTFSHAFWNLLGKRRRPSGAFFLVASLSAAACLAPFSIYFLQLAAGLPSFFWVMLAATGFSQAIYYIGLAGAYRHGDLSVAYPLVRALPVLFITLLTALLGLGERLSPGGLAGILIVAAGCLLLPMAHFQRMRRRDYLNAAFAMALLAALGTTGYTIIDSEALRLVRALPLTGLPGWLPPSTAVPLFFIALETQATALYLSLYVALTGRERRWLGEIWRNDRSYAALAGLIITGTYTLVLGAMAFVSNVSYLAAFRQLSIPIGAWLGFVVQKEPATRPRLAGVGLVLIGLVLVSLA